MHLTSWAVPFICQVGSQSGLVPGGTKVKDAIGQEAAQALQAGTTWAQSRTSTQSAQPATEASSLSPAVAAPASHWLWQKPSSQAAQVDILLHSRSQGDGIGPASGPGGSWQTPATHWRGAWQSLQPPPASGQIGASLWWQPHSREAIAPARVHRDIVLPPSRSLGNASSSIADQGADLIKRNATGPGEGSMPRPRGDRGQRQAQ